MFFGREPSLHHLRVVGCLCFAVNHHTNGDKFDTRSIESVFMGYSTTQKGYKLYNLSTKSFFISRDVMFREDQYPFQHIQAEFWDSSSIENSDMFVYDDPPNIPLPEVSVISPNPTSSSPDPDSSSPTQISQSSESPSTYIEHDLRKLTRSSKPPGWLHGFVHTAFSQPCTFTYLFYCSSFIHIYVLCLHIPILFSIIVQFLCYTRTHF